MSVHEKPLVQRVVANVLGAAFVAGPPAWALYVVLVEGVPLLANRTVTTTRLEYYGVVPDVLPVLLIWALVLVTGWATVKGYLPGMRL